MTTLKCVSLTGSVAGGPQCQAVRACFHLRFQRGSTVSNSADQQEREFKTRLASSDMPSSAAVTLIFFNLETPESHYKIPEHPFPHV